MSKNCDCRTTDGEKKEENKRQEDKSQTVERSTNLCQLRRKASVRRRGAITNMEEYSRKLVNSKAPGSHNISSELVGMTHSTRQTNHIYTERRNNTKKMTRNYNDFQT